jgi:LysR family transcriptional regulator, cyn operon transcriptional activator
MELRHLRYFVAIAESGTMAKAAGRVHVTQSTLSHQLAQLEAEIGAALFERVGRSLRLSDAGTAWLGHARGVLAQIDEARRATARTRRLETGEIRIGVIHSFVTKLMPDVAASFVKRHPGIRLQVHEMPGLEIESQVEAGALDFGFAFFPPSGTAVAGERLFDDTLALAVHDRHALAAQRSIRFAQLAGVPLAMLTARFATRQLLDGYFRRTAVVPQVVIEIDSVDALERIAELGVAATFLPRRTTRPRRAARLRLLDVTDPRPVRAAGLVWRKTAYRSAAAAAFAEHLKSALAERPAAHKGSA